MHRKLIIKAFEKAKEIEKRRGIKAPSNTSIAKLLSDFIEEKEQFSFGERRLRDYYSLALKNDSNDVNIIQQKVILGLCKYLDYKDYQHFLKENPPEKERINTNFISTLNRKNITISSFIIVILITYLGYDLTKKECMIWNTNHYVRIKCEGKAVNTIQYNETIFQKLKQIEPDCNYPFFKPDGSENLWYGKSIKGELEYFTYHGLHPITG